MSSHWWRTVLIQIPAIGTYTIVLGAVSLLSSLFDRSGHFAHGCARLWSRLILATTGVRVRVEGLERLEPGKTYVFVSNHQSIYDIPVIFWWLPHQLRIIAKESLGAFPFIGWHLRRSGHLLVDRRNPDRKAILEKWRSLVVGGVSLIIFPEGTRSADGRLGPFKSGSFMLAMEAGMPVAPLSIVGTRFVMPKGRMAVAPGDVVLSIHAPIETSGRSGAPTIDDARALAGEVRAIIGARVEALERERGTWPSAPPSVAPTSQD